MDGDTILRIAHRLEARFWPRRHGELRSSISYWSGIPIALLGVTLLLVQVGSGSQVSWWPNIVVSIGMVLFGFALAALRWSRTLHFRRHGVFVLRFNKCVRYERYCDWTRVELGPLMAPLQVIRKDGSTWKLPNPDEDETDIRGEILWQLDRAGVPIPDQVARQNRMGIGDLAPFAVSAAQSNPTGPLPQIPPAP